MKIICLLVLLAVLTAGCGKMPNGAADIRMVIYQPAEWGRLPMSSRWPLRGKPMEITGQRDIAAIFDAVSQPDGKAFTRMGRNDGLALVRQNGQVVIYGIVIAGFLGCDITREQSSKKLSTALPAALARAQVVKLKLASPIQKVSYHNTVGATKSVSAKNQALQELLGTYSPLALKGNRHCEASEIQEQAHRTPRFLTVKLTKPDAFDAIVAVKDSEWPPETYDTSARLKRIRFDTITIFHESNGLARFVFTDTQKGECLFTDPINSLRLVKEAQGRIPRVYGPDLFEDLVSQITKP